MKKLLVVVDMQNDFIDGALGTKEAQERLPLVLEKVKSSLKASDEIVFTLDTHNEDYMDTQEGKHLPIPHCIRFSPGWELHKSLQSIPGKRFEKNTFASQQLAQYIVDQSFDEVELIGLCTDICVISNALLIKAFAPNLLLSVDSKCCAGVTPQSHDNALKAMEMCQVIIK
ncbi:MAG: cysteine hydrolase [Clostridiales bacterium]|nr:cysteine hydrolase [Clostridiales bacterium]